MQELNIEIIGDKLIFSKFPEKEINVHLIDNAYSILLANLRGKDVLNVVLDLSGASYKNRQMLAFWDAIVATCMIYKVKVNVDNASNELISILKELGFIWASKGVFIRHKKSHSQPFFVTIGEFSNHFYQDIKSFIGFGGEIFSAFIYSIRYPRKIQWREALYYMDKSGADGVPIVFIICFLMGCILAYQGAIQMGRFGLSVFVADLVGLVIVKELAALMVSMVCIGRAGSAFAAEIGTMQVSEEIDAMDTMGLRTSRFLVVPKIIALAIMMPLLTIVGDVAGIFGGTVTGVLKTGLSFQQYYERTVMAITFHNVCEGVLKSIVFAIIIAFVGCLRGYETERDAKGVGRAATSSVVTGIFLIVVADGIMTVLLN